MAKRTSRNSEGVPNKKARTDDFDDLWGDDLDLDENVIDDCFKLASQVIEQKDITCTQLNNVSILPTYNAFKGQRTLFSSTQSAPEVNNYQRATTSSVSRTLTRKNNSLPKEVYNSHDNDARLKELREQILAKEGEVAILRSQLKEVKANFEVENARKQKEWLEKLHEKTKEINEIQSKLEFKDLEIISLKQKRTEISRFNNNLNLSYTQEFVKLKQNSKLNDKSCTLKEKSVNPKIQPVIEKHRPLQQIIPLCIFNVAEQKKYFIRNKSNDKPPTLFHSPLSQFAQEENPSEPFVHNRKLNLSCVFSEIGILLGSTAAEIEASKVVNEIFKVSFTLLHTFLGYLKQVEQGSRTEDLVNADVVYLRQKSLKISDVSLFDGRNMCENEIGINVRQSIAFIAELIPYNSNLKECLNDLVTFDTERSVSGRFLEILHECVTLIGKFRLSGYCVGVLCAVIRLLTKLEKCCYEKYGDLVDLLFKEIVLSRPEINVLLEFSFFLKAASHNAVFIRSLCTMQPESILKLNPKEGYFTYNQNTCLFHVLSVLYGSYLEYSKGDLLLKMCENVLSFLHNAITQNSRWLYCKEQETCKCLYMAIKLTVEFIICCLSDYKQRSNQNDSSPSKYSRVFTLSVKLLHIIHFKMCALMEKYITMYASFIDAVKRLYQCRSEMEWNEETSKLLESLMSVDVEESEVNVTIECFNSVSLCDDLNE